MSNTKSSTRKKIEVLIILMCKVSNNHQSCLKTQ